MQLAFFKKTLAIANGATSTETFEVSKHVFDFAACLAMIQLSAAITANTGYLEMSSNGTDWDKIYDSAGNQLTFAMSAKAYTQLDPTRYCIFDKYLRVTFSSAVSAGVNIILHFRQAS